MSSKNTHHPKADGKGKDIHNPSKENTLHDPTQGQSVPTHGSGEKQRIASLFQRDEKVTPVIERQGISTNSIWGVMTLDMAGAPLAADVMEGEAAFAQKTAEEKEKIEQEKGKEKKTEDVEKTKNGEKSDEELESDKAKKKDVEDKETKKT